MHLFYESADPSYPQGPHTIAVEGTTVINGLNTQANEFITITDQPVTVTDGQLTLSLTRSGGSTKTILNSLIITSVSTSASLALPDARMYFAALRGNDNQGNSPHLHHAVLTGQDQLPSSPIIRNGGGLFSLRFGLPQLEDHRGNPLVHLVSHGGTVSTTISPAAGSVLPGLTVTFSWSYAGENTNNTDVAYKYTGKEQDGSTGLYFYEARYYDPILGRFISADTIVPDPENPQEFNRYSYVLNNPLKLIDPTGNYSSGCSYCGGSSRSNDITYNEFSYDGTFNNTGFNYFSINQFSNTPFVASGGQNSISRENRSGPGKFDMSLSG